MNRRRIILIIVLAFVAGVAVGSLRLIVFPGRDANSPGEPAQSTPKDVIVIHTQSSDRSSATKIDLQHPCRAEEVAAAIDYSLPRGNEPNNRAQVWVTLEMTWDSHREGKSWQSKATSTLPSHYIVVTSDGACRLFADANLAMPPVADGPDRFSSLMACVKFLVAEGQAAQVAMAEANRRQPQTRP